MKILEFTTKLEAENALTIINLVTELWYIRNGYTVIAHQLVPKNAETSENDLTAARTLTWDEVKASPLGTYYISSPSNDRRFPDWRSEVPIGIELPVDIDKPVDWVQEEPEDVKVGLISSTVSYIKNLFA